VAIGVVFALLALFSGIMSAPIDRILAVICFGVTPIYAAAALLAYRTRRYAAPGAMISLTLLTVTAVSTFRTGPAETFGPVFLLFAALTPQLAAYLLGTRAGIAMGIVTMTHITLAFVWLRLHPETGELPHLTVKYIMCEAGIVVGVSLSFLYTRARTRMVAELRAAHVALDALRLAKQRRLQEEIDLAARIQTALLPNDLCVEGLEISASMLSAVEVGGDYYDVLPFEGGAWLCIGDVAGHGLNAGLTMLMMQSAVSALAEDDPARSPERMLRALNATLYKNIRQRMRRDEHATLTLLRYCRDGSVIFAGAHEELLVFRAAEARCETIPTPGPWMGAKLDITASLRTSRVVLGDGDILLLYTDGLTEAMNEGRRQFGIERVEAEILRAAEQPVEAIKEAILGAVRAFSPVFADDIALLVARYHAPASGGPVR
jgi:serine phosphatase RsbU (regulator of sigma subunit)